MTVTDAGCMEESVGAAVQQPASTTDCKFQVYVAACHANIYFVRQGCTPNCLQAGHEGTPVTSGGLVNTRDGDTLD